MILRWALEGREDWTGFSIMSLALGAQSKGLKENPEESDHVEMIES